MKTQLAAFEIMHIVKELQVLVDGKVEQIYVPENKEVVIQVHIPGKEKQFLKIKAPNYIYLSTVKDENAAPGQFCMMLRKNLSGARVRAIKQHGFERILEIEFETKNEKIIMIIELFSKGNVILVKNGKIMLAAEQQEWSNRKIKPGEEYNMPKAHKDAFLMTAQEIDDMINKSEKENIVKTLAIELGLGGVYAEEVCLIAGIDKNQKGLNDSVKIKKAVMQIKDANLNPRVVLENGIVIDAVPVSLQKYSGNEQKLFEKYSAALEIAFSKENQEQKQKSNKYDKQIEKMQTIIDDQSKKLKQLEESSEENKQKGELLYNHYQEIDSLLKELNKARSEKKNEEMRKILLKNSAVFEEKEGKVVVMIKDNSS